MKQTEIIKSKSKLLFYKAIINQHNYIIKTKQQNVHVHTTHIFFNIWVSGEGNSVALVH